MKFSEKSIEVIKNFSTINQGIIFKEGNTLKTVSPQKNVLAVAELEDDIEKEFAIHDLNNFLTVASTSDSGEFLFDDSQHIIITSESGMGELRYRFSSSNMIVAPPEKDIQFPTPEINIDIPAKSLEAIFRTAGIINTPHIGFISDGENVYATAFDAVGAKNHQYKLNLGKGNGDAYECHFKLENLKVIPGDYELNISSKGVSHWKNKNRPIEYWVTLEPGSKYQKA